MNDTSTQTTVTVQAVRVGVDGCLEVIDLGAAPSTGAAIRSAIGCRWFDVVRLNRDLDMWITSHTEVRSRRSRCASSAM
ncbi:hypothetical protein [Rhodococcus koreensis]